MKTKILLALTLLCSTFSFSQEAFYIENYHVDIKLKTNASFEVTETIEVFFTEKRRGIIRKIPVRYQFDKIENDNKKEYAFGVSSSKKYEILINRINVEGHNSTVSDDGYYKTIKIGSADKFLSGKQKYIVKYTVWGAINEFMNHSEFSWNVIGLEWEVEIKKASFSFRLERPTRLNRNDVQLYAGKEDSKEYLSRLYFTQNQYGVNGKTKVKLKPKEGITLLVKLPWNYFRDMYRIKEHIANIRLEKDGSFIVRNIQTVDYNGHQQYIRNRLPTTIKKPKKDLQLRLMRDYMFDSIGEKAIWVHGVRSTKVNYKTTGAKREFGYSVINGKTEFKDGEGLFWKWDMREMYREFDTLIIKAELLKHTKPQNVLLSKNGNPVNYEMKGNQLYATISQIGRTDIVELKVVYPKWTYTEPLPPKHKVYDIDPSYVIEFDDQIHINEDATVLVKRNYLVEFRDEIKNDEHFPFYTEVDKMVKYKHDLSYTDHYFIIEEVNKYKSEYYDSYGNLRINWDRNEGEAVRKAEFKYDYLTYNMLLKDGENYELNINLYENSNYPVISGKVAIHFPYEVNEKELYYDLFADYQHPAYDITSKQVLDSILVLNFQLKEHIDYVPSVNYLRLQLPKNNIRNSLIKDTKIFLGKHDDEVNMVIALLITIAVLFVIWFFLGRDKKMEIEEIHYLPADLSPPEVGYIWDGKLHKRDLIALIYHWSATGYLKINNFYEGDISFTRIKNLPGNRKSFEYTIFNGLFGKKDTVSLSSLRDSFYRTMKKAGAEFKKYARNNRLLMPGTRGFGKLLIITGIVFGSILSFIALAEEEWFITIWAILMASTLIIFGRIMPKFGHLGAKMNNKVLGFKRFIEDSEVDRLLFVLEEDPDYFDKTISYAIVMGMGKKWAKKFKGLINSKGKPIIKTEKRNLEIDDEESEEEFDTSFFFKTLIKRMHKFEDDFHYKKPPARSSYSSSSSSSRRSRSYSSFSFKSSSSSSSSSSRSYGGSSSFGSSSSGSSGSGYGGGGGSSW